MWRNLAIEEPPIPCPEGHSLALDSMLWFWLHDTPWFLSPWFLSSSFTCREAALCLGSPLGVLVTGDAQHIVLALGYPKKVETHSVGWGHEPSKKGNVN